VINAAAPKNKVNCVIGKAIIGKKKGHEVTVRRLSKLYYGKKSVQHNVVKSG
jgi:hypothetical protein